MHLSFAQVIYYFCSPRQAQKHIPNKRFRHMFSFCIKENVTLKSCLLSFQADSRFSDSNHPPPSCLNNFPCASSICLLVYHLPPSFCSGNILNCSEIDDALTSVWHWQRSQQGCINRAHRSGQGREPQRPRHLAQLANGRNLRLSLWDHTALRRPCHSVCYLGATCFWTWTHAKKSRPNPTGVEQRGTWSIAVVRNTTSMDTILFFWLWPGDTSYIP